jgi:SAM-dependent methyltransferase
MTLRPSMSFDRVADQYDDTRGGTQRGAHMGADVVPWLAAGRILEVGVGTGVVSAALRDHGLTVHGVDLSAGMLRRAVRRLGSTVARADALALPIASAAVDNVLFVAALHAIGDIPGAFREAARVLRPGGRVVAIHGAPRRESTTDDVTEALGPLDPMRDARPDTREALDAAAAGAGLEPAGGGWKGPVSYAESPNTVADLLANRLWSYLWHLDESTYQAVVVPVMDRLRALPDPDRPRTYLLSYSLTAYTRP